MVRNRYISSARAASGQVNDVERQQIDLGVPENMPMIIISRQPTRSDGDVLVRRVNGAIQMIGSETQRQLCSRISSDLEIAALPSL